MRLKSEDRAMIKRELGHWGRVARRRWQADPRPVHPLARMQELGISIGPSVYDSDAGYEPDQLFDFVDHKISQLPITDRAILSAQYIDRKPWRIMRKMMDLASWHEVGKRIKRAETNYAHVRLDG